MQRKKLGATCWEGTGAEKGDGAKEHNTMSQAIDWIYELRDPEFKIAIIWHYVDLQSIGGLPERAKQTLFTFPLPSQRQLIKLHSFSFWSHFNCLKKVFCNLGALVHLLGQSNARLNASWSSVPFNLDITTGPIFTPAPVCCVLLFCHTAD